MPTKINKEPVSNENGITVKQLKEWVKDLPEVDSNGEDYEIYISPDGTQSSIVSELWKLNEGDIVMISYDCDAANIVEANATLELGCFLTNRLK